MPRHQASLSWYLGYGGEILFVVPRNRSSSLRHLGYGGGVFFEVPRPRASPARVLGLGSFLRGASPSGAFFAVPWLMAFSPRWLKYGVEISSRCLLLGLVRRLCGALASLGLGRPLRGASAPGVLIAAPRPLEFIFAATRPQAPSSRYLGYGGANFLDWPRPWVSSTRFFGQGRLRSSLAPAPGAFFAPPPGLMRFFRGAPASGDFFAVPRP